MVSSFIFLGQSSDKEKRMTKKKNFPIKKLKKIDKREFKKEKWEKLN